MAGLPFAPTSYFSLLLLLLFQLSLPLATRETPHRLKSLGDTVTQIQTR